MHTPNHPPPQAPQVVDVLMVSTSYPRDLADWHGLFIRHLVDSLARRDDVSLQLWAPPGEAPENVTCASTPGERRWLRALIAKGGIAHQLRSSTIGRFAAPLRLLWLLRKLYRRTPSDLYHVNWLQNALALPRNRRPLLTSVLGSDMQFVELPFVRQLLRRVFHHRPAAICPNAEWMVPVLKRTFGDVAHVRFVPFGIDPSWFRVERTFHLCEIEKWLCITRLTPGKVGTLFDWCKAQFIGRRRELHVFGPMQQDMAVPEWVHYHGPTTPDKLCDEWFPRAHGLITLSQHAEGRPQVIMEAMAAGLPIIASCLPAHTDIVQHGVSGLVCDTAEDVGLALDTLGDIATNLRMGEQGRKWVAERIGTWDDCANRYAEVYRELLSEQEQ